MKILALYLPQYHTIPENDSWWGKGYTEWTAVKGAKTLSPKHTQPHVPANKFYYDLSDDTGSVWKWQADLATTYGIYGFCIYHYWFGTKQLLEKPMEILLHHPEINTKYCICWANETWTKTWYDKNNELLIKQEYGGKSEWDRHYKYLSKFFKDERYIKVNGKPLFNIYRPSDISCLDEMLDLWESLAKKDGFPGLYIVCSKNSVGNGTLNSEYVSAQYSFEPGYSTKNGMGTVAKIKYGIPIALRRFVNSITSGKAVERVIDIRQINNQIIKNYIKEKDNSKYKRYIGVCPRWDNTPRRGEKGTIYYNTTPKVFADMLDKIKKLVDDDDFVYLNAWNEWGEGCHLEPDELYGNQYLEVVKNICGGEN